MKNSLGRFFAIFLVVAVAFSSRWAFAAPAPAATVSEKQVQAALTKHPEWILDILRKNRKELFKIVNEAFQEAQADQAKEREEQDKKDREEAFVHPYVPQIDDTTHIRGDKDAKYTIVEYSDFQCPYCGMAFKTVEALRKKYGSDMRFIFKNTPLPMHPQAMPAAQFFEAVSLQSPEKAWLFHDKMFQNQSNLSEDFFKQTAKDLGIDVARAEKDAKSQKVQDMIKADMQEGQQFGFSGTPGFLVNGVPIRGNYPIEDFDAIIKELDQKSKDSKKI